jgi:acetyl esterase
MLTAEFDPLLDDGFKYYNQLMEAGNRVQYKEYKGLFHSFFNLPGVAPAAMQSYYDIKTFLDGLKK